MSGKGAGDRADFCFPPSLSDSLQVRFVLFRRFPNRLTFRTAAESMGRQETTWRTETS